MRAMMGRRLAALVALFVCGPMLLLPASGTAAPFAPIQTDSATDSSTDGATAEPSDGPLVTFVGSTPTQVDDDTDPLLPSASFDSGDLGLGDTITLLRPAGRREIDIAVADGLVFTAFKTTVVVPSAVHEIQLDMSIDGASVFSATVPGGSTEELTFTLDTPVATDTTLVISVEERFGATCTSSVVEQSALRLVDNEFFFERIDTRPENIADFFPPVLQSAIVVIDPGADPSVRSASLELATALARRYAQMPTLDVVHQPAEAANPLPPPVSNDPFTRTVVLSEADEATMQVQQGINGTYLEIAGPPGLLEEMAAAVSAPQLAFITRDTVRVEDLEEEATSLDLLGQRSLRDVGVRRLSATGSRVLELPISLPQAAFGEPVEEIRVRLGGVALASSTQGQDPVLTLWFNGDLQDSIDYDGSGRFDLEFVIDASKVGRDNVVVVRSELPLDCGDELPNHELTLDAASWVDPEPGQSLPPSLDRFPQVALGSFVVATGPTATELELAMSTVGVLQGASPLAIHPTAASIEEVLGGSTAALVVTDGDGWVGDAVARDLTTVQSEKLAFVSGGYPQDLAFLAVSGAAGQRDLLVLFSPTEDLSRSFVDYATTRGWSAFGGDAIGLRGSGDVVRSVTPTADVVEAALSTLIEPEEEVSVARQFGLGAVLAVLLVFLVVAVRFVLGALRRLR